MYTRVPSLIRILLIALIAPFLAQLATSQIGHDYLFEQDFQSAPPELQGLVADWVDWVGYGEYERTGGQPFASPVPPGLVPEVTDIYIDVEGGSTLRGDGCLYTWKDEFVWIQFSDGSSFLWWSLHTELDCPGGSVEVFDHVLSSGGVEDPQTGAWSGWVRSYSMEDLQVARRASLRGSAGAVVSSSALGSASRPLVGSGYGDVDVTLAPGGVLDLRGLSGAQGPLFQTDLPVLLRCDTVLLDPGVVIADLFVPAPNIGPAAVVQELALLGNSPAVLHEGASDKRLCLASFGNEPGPALLDWIDVLGWSWGGPLVVPTSPMQAVSFALPFQVPPGVPAGTGSDAQVSMQAGQYQQYGGMALFRAEVAPPPAQVYCLAKPNSLGCLPRISTSGAPTLTGYDDFVIHATDVLPAKFGVAFHGFGADQVPLQGGWLCMQVPLVRTPVRLAAPLGSGATCDGWYSFHMTQEYMASEGFGPGTNVCAQWWSRDPAAPFGTGLSDAVSFTVGL